MGGRQSRQSNAGSVEDASAEDRIVGKFLHKISARHSTDMETCSFVGSVLLPGGRLAVLDIINKCVKLIDLEARKLTGKVSFSVQPRDITAIGDDRLAVVSYDIDCENEQVQFKNQCVHLQLLRVTPKLARSITLPLPSRFYWGVTCQGDKLYLACLDPPSIQIFDLHGTLLSQINGRTNDGGLLFECPFSIAVSPDGAHIYICNLYDVLCLTTEGQEVWTYRGLSRKKDVDKQGGFFEQLYDLLTIFRMYFIVMDVEKQGRLFVCNLGPSITFLTSAGRPGTLLLDDKYSDTVAVGDNRMYLSGHNEISVYRLEAADSARQGEEENRYVGVEKNDEEDREKEGKTGDEVDSGEQKDDVLNAAEDGNDNNADGEEKWGDSEEDLITSCCHSQKI